LENASAAVAALEVLTATGTDIPHEAIIKGLREVHWPGRLHIVGREPTIIVDGAHNTHSMERLKEAIEKYVDHDMCHVIFGTSCDKDITGMATVLSSFADHITVTSSAHPRAASIDSVREAFEKQGIAITIQQNIADALSEVTRSAQKNDLILITGSLFVVGEALSHVEKK
jgi:dihydrofolate synthase/folylpolyglutamate synthase